MYIVWRITPNKCYEIARFSYKTLANWYKEAREKLYPATRYEVTKAGDTPIY